MAGDGNVKTPLLDQLESGPWPNFVKEIKQARQAGPMAEVLLGQLDLSYQDKKGHWKHDGLVGVLGCGGGVIGRYSDVADKPAAGLVQGGLKSGILPQNDNCHV